MSATIAASWSASVPRRTRAVGGSPVERLELAAEIHEPVVVGHEIGRRELVPGDPLEEPEQRDLVAQQPGLLGLEQAAVGEPLTHQLGGRREAGERHRVRLDPVPPGRDLCGVAPLSHGLLRVQDRVVLHPRVGAEPALVPLRGPRLRSHEVRGNPARTNDGSRAWSHAS